MSQEMRNCLEEAHLARPENALPTGEGPILVEVIALHRCRSTDASAGSYVCEARRFPDHDTAEAWILQHPYLECDETDFRVSPRRSTLSLPEHPTPPEDDGAPF